MSDCNLRRRCSYCSKRGEREAQTGKIYPPFHQPSGLTQAASVSCGFSKSGHERCALCSIAFCEYFFGYSEVGSHLPRLTPALSASVYPIPFKLDWERKTGFPETVLTAR